MDSSFFNIFFPCTVYVKTGIFTGWAVVTEYKARRTDMENIKITSYEDQMLSQPDIVNVRWLMTYTDNA